MTVQAAGLDAVPPIVLEVEAAERRHRTDFRIRFILTWVVILGADGSRDELPLLSKREVADRLLDRVVALVDEHSTPAHTASRPTEAP